MKILLQIASFLGLLLLCGACIAYLFGSMDTPMLKHLALVGSIIWFATCPFWIGKESA